MTSQHPTPPTSTWSADAAAPSDAPRDFLTHLYRVAVERALPLASLGAHLPPPPRGRPDTTARQDVVGGNKDDDDDDSEQGREIDEEGRLGATNVRSLTELDVNFAKSMLRPGLAEGVESPPERSIRHGVRQQQQKQQQADSKDGGKTGAASQTNEAATSQSGPAKGGDSHDLDLVISPEYNCGPRLKLRPSGERLAGGAKSPDSNASNESISYV